MLASLAPYLDPALWAGWFRAGATEIDTTVFWVAVAQLIFIDILLSGDNAVVIAMACRELPLQQRRWGLVIGAGVAVALRVILVGVLAWLMLLPYLKLAGGVALLFIAAKLLVPEEADRAEIQAVAHLWRAVMIIAVADIVMSIDNMIAIAAVAEGNLLLLAIGLAVSIPLIVAGAALVLALLNRFPILVWAGTALLGWIAGEIIVADAALSTHLAASFGGQLARQIEFAAPATGAALAIAAGGLWRCWHESRATAVGRQGGGA
jgi:YjbE family integral membrane protein